MSSSDDNRSLAKASPSEELVRYSSYAPFTVVQLFDFATPRVDIWHEGEHLFIDVDLPGVSPDDFDVVIDEYSLTIEGERRGTREGNVARTERPYGRFERVIPLPQHVDTNTAEARFDNGVLEIKVRAIAPRPQGRKLQVTVVHHNQPQAASH